LFDWDLSLLQAITGIIGINPEIRLTDSYRESGYTSDYRNSIHPKYRHNKPDPFFNPKSYQQVFISRHGFIPDLSIIDLIFNEGPYTLQIIKESITRPETG